MNAKERIIIYIPGFYVGERYSSAPYFNIIKNFCHEEDFNLLIPKFWWNELQSDSNASDIDEMIEILSKLLLENKLLDKNISIVTISYGSVILFEALKKIGLSSQGVSWNVLFIAPTFGIRRRKVLEKWINYRIYKGKNIRPDNKEEYLDRLSKSSWKSEWKNNNYSVILPGYDWFSKRSDVKASLGKGVDLEIVKYANHIFEPRPTIRNDIFNRNNEHYSQLMKQQVNIKINNWLFEQKEE